MDKTKLIQILGFVLTLIGGLATTVASNRKMDQKIEEEVSRIVETSTEELPV